MWQFRVSRALIAAEKPQVSSHFSLPDGFDIGSQKSATKRDGVGIGSDANEMGDLSTSPESALVFKHTLACRFSTANSQLSWGVQWWNSCQPDSKPMISSWRRLVILLLIRRISVKLRKRVLLNWASHRITPILDDTL